MRRTSRILGIAVTLAAVSLGAAASAQTPSRAVVERALSGFEHAPDADTLRAWGPGGAQPLMEVAADAAVIPATRARALHALARWGSDAGVRAFLEATARRDGQSLLLLRASLDALVEGCGDLLTAGSFLDDGRPEVRDAAAWALQRTADPAARALLAVRLRSEQDPVVRRTLSDALRPATVAPPSAPAHAVR